MSDTPQPERSFDSCQSPLKMRKAPAEGMAYFPGTGPDGKVCIDCRHFDAKGVTCAEFKRMVPKPKGKPRHPGRHAAACKYFDQKERRLWRR